MRLILLTDRLRVVGSLRLPHNSKSSADWEPHTQGVKRQCSELTYSLVPKRPVPISSGSSRPAAVSSELPNHSFHTLGRLAGSRRHSFFLLLDTALSHSSNKRGYMQLPNRYSSHSTKATAVPRLRCARAARARIVTDPPRRHAPRRAIAPRSPVERKQPIGQHVLS